MDETTLQKTARTLLAEFDAHSHLVGIEHTRRKLETYLRECAAGIIPALPERWSWLRDIEEGYYNDHKPFIDAYGYYIDAWVAAADHLPRTKGAH